MQNVTKNLPLKNSGFEIPNSEFRDEASGVANLNDAAKLRVIDGVVVLAIVIVAVALVVAFGFLIGQIIAVHFHHLKP